MRIQLHSRVIRHIDTARKAVEQAAQAILAVR
jgi:hypothetical protein